MLWRVWSYKLLP